MPKSNSRKIRDNNRDFRKGMEETSANLMDMVEMTQITRAHALENKEVNKMTTLLNKVANTGFHLDVIQALFGACSWVIFQLFQLLGIGLTGNIGIPNHDSSLPCSMVLVIE